MSLTKRPVLQLSFLSHTPTDHPGTRLTFQISQSVRILLPNWGWPPPWGPGPWLLGGLQAAGVMAVGEWAQVEGAAGASAGSWASGGLERWTGKRERGDPNELSLEVAVTARPQAPPQNPSLNLCPR